MQASPSALIEALMAHKHVIRMSLNSMTIFNVWGSWNYELTDNLSFKKNLENC